MSRTFNHSHPSLPQTPGLKIDLYESAPHLLSLCVVDASLSSVHPLLSSNRLHPWCLRFMLICGGRCIRYLLHGSPFCFLLLPRGWWFQECLCMCECVWEWWFKASWKTARRPRGYRLRRLAGAVAGQGASCLSRTKAFCARAYVCVAIVELWLFVLRPCFRFFWWFLYGDLVAHIARCLRVGFICRRKNDFLRIWLPTVKDFLFIFWLAFFNSDFGQGRRVGVCGRRDFGSSDGEPCVNLGGCVGTTLLREEEGVVFFGLLFFCVESSGFWTSAGGNLGVVLGSCEAAAAAERIFDWMCEEALCNSCVWRRTQPVGGKTIWACSHPWNGIRDGNCGAQEAPGLEVAEDRLEPKKPAVNSNYRKGLCGGFREERMWGGEGQIAQQPNRRIGGWSAGMIPRARFVYAFPCRHPQSTSWPVPPLFQVSVGSCRPVFLNFLHSTFWWPILSFFYIGYSAPTMCCSEIQLPPHPFVLIALFGSAIMAALPFSSAL